MISKIKKAQQKKGHIEAGRAQHRYLMRTYTHMRSNKV